MAKAVEESRVLKAVVVPLEKVRMLWNNVVLPIA